MSSWRRLQMFVPCVGKMHFRASSLTKLATAASMHEIPLEREASSEIPGDKIIDSRGTIAVEQAFKPYRERPPQQKSSAVSNTPEAAARGY
ncbi:MAG: hypothetical protein ACYCZB_05475 [Acidiphilium sp.]